MAERYSFGMTVTHAPITNRPAAGAIVSRLSVKASERKVLTVAEQERQGDGHARALGVPIVERYAEDGVSGYRKVKRPTYDAFLSDVEAGRYTHVFLRAMDRGSRRLVPTARLIEACEDSKTWIVLDGRPHHPTDDMLALVLQGAMGKQESINIVKRSGPARETALRAGRYMGGKALGYDYPANSAPGHRVVNQKARAAILDGYRMILDEGLSAVVVAEDWNRRKLERARGGFIPWTGSKARRTLLAPILSGDLQYRGEIVGKLRLPDGSDWPAIVTTERREALARALRVRAASRAHAPRTPRPSLLSGLLGCAHCGRDLYAKRYREGTNTNGQRPQYLCMRHGDGGCGGVGIRMADVEAFVVDAVLAAVDTPKWRRRVERASKAARAKSTGEDPAGIQADMDALNKAHDAGRLSTANYLGRIEPLEARMAEALRADLGDVDMAAVREVLADGTPTAERFAEFGEDTRRAFLAWYVERVEVERVGKGRRVPVKDRITVTWRA